MDFRSRGKALVAGVIAIAIIIVLFALVASWFWTLVKAAVLSFVLYLLWPDLRSGVLASSWAPLWTQAEKTYEFLLAWFVPGWRRPTPPTAMDAKFEDWVARYRHLILKHLENGLEPTVVLKELMVMVPDARVRAWLSDALPTLERELPQGQSFRLITEDEYRRLSQSAADVLSEVTRAVEQVTIATTPTTDSATPNGWTQVRPEELAEDKSPQSTAGSEETEESAEAETQAVAPSEPQVELFTSQSPRFEMTREELAQQGYVVFTKEEWAELKESVTPEGFELVSSDYLTRLKSQQRTATWLNESGVTPKEPVQSSQQPVVDENHRVVRKESWELFLKFMEMISQFMATHKRQLAAERDAQGDWDI